MARASAGEGTGAWRARVPPSPQQPGPRGARLPALLRISGGNLIHSPLAPSLCCALKHEITRFTGKNDMALQSHTGASPAAPLPSLPAAWQRSQAKPKSGSAADQRMLQTWCAWGAPKMSYQGKIKGKRRSGADSWKKLGRPWYLQALISLPQGRRNSPRCPPGGISTEGVVHNLSSWLKTRESRGKKVFSPKSRCAFTSRVYELEKK